MKITANEIKQGMIIEHKNDLWNVLKTQHVKPGKGGAFNQVELKSVMKGTKLNERFRSSETIEKAEVNEKKFNFLYIDGENCHFMNNTTYEQVELPKSITGEQHKLLKENLEVLKKAKKSFNKPIIAIGGINNQNFNKVLNSGAKYIALSSFIWDNPNLKPEVAIRKFK